jgi:hypothetical protein
MSAAATGCGSVLLRGGAIVFMEIELVPSFAQMPLDVIAEHAAEMHINPRPRPDP